MILKTKCPRTAIILSYKNPILYKDFVLLDGTVKVGLSDDVVNIVVNKIKKGTTI